MRKLKLTLVALISGISVTGISFIDGEVWRVVFLIVGMVAYSIVGGLFSIGLLSSRKAGKDAYVFIFVLLVLAGIGFYKLLESVRFWILSLPLFVKILVPSIIITGLAVGVFFVVRKMIKTKKNKKDDENNE